MSKKPKHPLTGIRCPGFSTTNRQRARRIFDALATNPAYEMELDVVSGITDALADLRHLCQLLEVDYHDRDRVAYQHYLAENYGVGEKKKKKENQTNG